MRQSSLEKICAAQAAPIKKKCPIKEKALKGEILHEVPCTFIRNVIVLMARQYDLAGRIMKKRASAKSKNKSAWFDANQQAHALEVLVFQYLHKIRHENSNFHYVLYRGWKYSVTRAH